jgi:hypothetical protein
MSSGTRSGQGRDDSGEFKASTRAFHDLLLNRSKDALPPRRRNRLTKWLDRHPRLKRGISLLFLMGCGAIFAGGVALGAGIVLLRRGEELRGRPGMIIAAGLGCMLLTILAGLVVKFRSSLVTRKTAEG